MSRARCYLLTINNPSEVPLPGFPDWVSYAAYQLERGDSGTPHLQVYLECSKAVYFTAVKAAFPSAHIESRRGTQGQAIAYCTKAETRVSGPWFYGEPKKQGDRTDLKNVVAMINDPTCTYRDIVSENPETYIRYHRGIRETFGILRPNPSRENISIEIFWGPTGTGKSRRAHAENPNAYIYVDNVNGWFDGYTDESVVILDEFDCLTPLRLLLKLLDRYPHKMPVKGGFVPIVATKFVFTSNSDPAYWYACDAALARRFLEFAKITQVLPPACGGSDPIGSGGVFLSFPTPPSLEGGAGGDVHRT